MDTETIVEIFSLFDDWEDKYRFLIEEGDKLPPMPESLKCEDTRIKGCLSQVWMTLEMKDNVLFLQADSDAKIVKGLIALLFVLYQNKTREDAINVPVESIFTTLGLDSHISPNRRNGFFSMVEKIKGFISQYS